MLPQVVEEDPNDNLSDLQSPAPRKSKEEDGLPFIVEEGENENPTTFGGNSLCARASRRCWYGATRATSLMCLSVFAVCAYCVAPKGRPEAKTHAPLK